jgi:4-amino-4-deoxy-L-arabinose transferase-like glycosyltransferase
MSGFSGSRPSSVLAWLDDLAARAEMHATPIFVALSVAHFGLAWFFASRKLLWNDELYSYYIATLPTFRDVWGALSAGGEQTPPLFYAITRAFLSVFGISDLTIRLPQMLAFWVMSVCLYAFVRRRTSNLAGLIAATVPFVTYAYQYSYEARPYALVLGAAAFALLSWQSIGLGGSRRVWGTWLAVGLAATVWVHYYGLLVLAALALAEIVRSSQRRRIDLVVWGAMAASLLPVAFHIPLLRVGAASADTFWSPPQWVNLPDFYRDLLTPALVPLAAILVVTIAVHTWRPREEVWAADSRLPPADVAAALGFVLIPLLALVAAKLATGAFVNRYALAAVIGFAVLAGFGSASAFRRRPGLRLFTLVVLLGWFGLSQAREVIAPTGVWVPVSAASVQLPVDWVAAVPDATLPVVIADAQTFTVLAHYAPIELKKRIVYAADPRRALADLGHNSVERGMVDLVGPWFHTNVVPFDRFVAEHDRFLLYGNFVRLGFLNWILPELQAQGFRVELLERAGDTMLLLLSRLPDASSAPVGVATR